MCIQHMSTLSTFVVYCMPLLLNDGAAICSVTDTRCLKLADTITTECIDSVAITNISLKFWNVYKS